MPKCEQAGGAAISSPLPIVPLSLKLISHILELLVMPAQSYRMSCSKVFLWYMYMIVYGPLRLIRLR